MIPRCIPVAVCAMCPNLQRHYGQYECSKFNFQAIPDQEVGKVIPDWCPLPPHPSFFQQDDHV